MAAQKVLVIGLDGMTFDLLNPLLAHGTMPFLGSLLQEGHSGTLWSTTPPISATAWSTFIAGTNPGQHGILQFVTLRPGEIAAGEQPAQELFPGGVSLLNADSIRGKTLWDLLTAAGKRQVVINVPMTYPARPLNGCMVTGMMTPPSAQVFTDPPELSARLREAQYEIDLSVSEKEFDFDPHHLVDRLRELLRKRQDTALQLMGEESWDLFMVVFTTTDRLQHRFWKYVVPGGLEYDSPQAVQLRPELLGYFEELDEALTRLVQSAGPETTVVILSDHGFGPVSERTVHRLSLMEALGLGQAGAQSGVMRVRSFLEGRLGLTPTQLRRLAKRLLPTR